MLMIRFQRIGRVNDPAFRIVVLEKERAAKAGNIVEQVGTYNPRSKEFTLNEVSIKEWIAKGAQPTDSIRNLLINKGVLTGKKVNALPKKTPQKDEAAIAAAAAAVIAEVASAKATKVATEATATTESAKVAAESVVVPEGNVAVEEVQSVV